MISTALNRENVIKCWFQGLFKSPSINTNPATEYVCVSVFINVGALKLKYQILLVDTSSMGSEKKKKKVQIQMMGISLQHTSGLSLRQRVSHLGAVQSRVLISTKRTQLR